MTWCSENSTSPGFFLASSTIQCRFVNRFAGSMSPPVSPATGSLHAAPPFPAGSRRARFPRSQQYYEGATTSHPRICGHLWVRFRSPPDPSCFVFAAALLSRSEVPSRPGLCVCRPPEFPASSCGRDWDLSGLQAILPVPLLRSSTPVEPTCPRHLGHIDAAPALRTAKASATCISGLTHAASAPAALRFAFRVATHAQGSLPAGWLAFAGRASNPLDRCERFQLVLTVIPLSCSPDASAIAYCAVSKASSHR
jgi:hypothetical protein